MPFLSLFLMGGSEVSTHWKQRFRLVEITGLQNLYCSRANIMKKIRACVCVYEIFFVSLHR